MATYRRIFLLACFLQHAIFGQHKVEVLLQTPKNLHYNVKIIHANWDRNTFDDIRSAHLNGRLEVNLLARDNYIFIISNNSVTKYLFLVNPTRSGVKFVLDVTNNPLHGVVEIRENGQHLVYYFMDVVDFPLAENYFALFKKYYLNFE